MKEVANAKRDFVRIVGVHQISDTLSRSQNCRVHFAAFRVASAALHIALEEMMIYCVQYDLWDLGTPRIVEKDEARRARQCRESGANGFNGKVGIRSGRNFGLENALGFGLQAFTPGRI